MENCFVTKLKASVDNPDLPILETMQQFTLDAIIKSGNVSMTDEQKWALNHFFYQIGAIGETSLWNKVQFLFLPMIASSVDNAIKEYRHSTYLVPPGSSTLEDLIIENGGLQSTLGTKSMNFNSVTNISENSGDTGLLIAGSPNSGFIYNNSETANIYFNFTYDDESTSVKRLQATESYMSMYVVSGQPFSKRYNNASRDTMFALLNAKKPYDKDNAANFEQIMLKANGLPITYDNTTLHQGSDAFVDTSSKTVTNVNIQLSTGCVIGIMVGFNSTLTDAEKANVTDATLNLLSSFAS